MCSAALLVKKRQHQWRRSWEFGPFFSTQLWAVYHHVGSLVDAQFSIFGSLFFFFNAFIIATHRHALSVNCHLCWPMGAMKRKQWWKQTMITWILSRSKTLCTEAHKRMFHPSSTFDWNCGLKWAVESWGMALTSFPLNAHTDSFSWKVFFMNFCFLRGIKEKNGEGGNQR